MTNEYFNFEAGMRLPRLQTAKAAKVNAIFDAIVAAFDMLPSPSALATGTENYAEATGPANHYAATIPGFTAYIDGVTCLVRIPVTNTGPCFLDVNGLGEIPMRRANGAAIGIGDAAGGTVLQMTVISGTFRITSGLSLLGVAGIASNIGFSPPVGMTSTDVQAAILELKALVSAISMAASDISTVAAVGTIIQNSNVQTQLQRISAAIGNDPTFSSTISTLLGGKQPLATTLTLLAGLTAATDKLPYFSGAGAAALADFTPDARTLLGKTLAEMQGFLGAGGFIGAQFITASGTYTKTTGTKKTLEFIQGAGCNNGGGAGGLVINVRDVSAITTIAATIGAPGVPGGSTTFGSVTAAGGVAAQTVTLPASSGGLINIPGGRGHDTDYVTSPDSLFGRGGYVNSTNAIAALHAGGYGAGGGRNSTGTVGLGGAGCILVLEFG